MEARPKILVVDDDPSTLLSVSALLEEEGYWVVQQSRALGTSYVVMRERPDLVLLDVSMPGLAGDELALLIQKNAGQHRVRVLLYSGAPLLRLEQLATRTGADGFVQKGSSPTVLLGAIGRALSASPVPLGNEERSPRERR